jgi:hypothetical protein
MVVGFVSGTGAGLVETLVRSTAGGCFVSDDSEVWALRFEVSCALVFADELCDVSRSDFAEASEEVTFSTDSDAALMKKESEFNPPIHPRQMASANNNAPMIIVTPLRVTSAAAATTTRSRLSILISRSRANAACDLIGLA